MTILDYRTNQPPLKWLYINSFMIYNMLGHIYLNCGPYDKHNEELTRELFNGKV